MIFTSLAFMQVFQVVASRSASDSIFKIDFLGNRLLIVMILLVTGLQCLVIYTPLIRNIFSVMPLGLPDMGLAVSTGLIAFTAIEILKNFIKMRYSNP
jgi:Ca2+-transporting ATPase